MQSCSIVCVSQSRADDEYRLLCGVQSAALFKYKLVGYWLWDDVAVLRIYPVSSFSWCVSMLKIGWLCLRGLIRDSLLDYDIVCSFQWCVIR